MSKKLLKRKPMSSSFLTISCAQEDILQQTEQKESLSRTFFYSYNPTPFPLSLMLTLIHTHNPTPTRLSLSSKG